LPKHAKIANMPTVKLDKFGRVLIPKAMRDALSVDNQQDLQLSIEDGAFMLRPAHPAAVKMVDGLPLLEVEHIDNAIEVVRRERDERLSGL
jgi:bifunctional DNA-binding transcriptional regulator/antitoxin component of YhaV-PrlF toxin-antitoxin module